MIFKSSYLNPPLIHDKRQAYLYERKNRLDGNHLRRPDRRKKRRKQIDTIHFCRIGRHHLNLPRCFKCQPRLIHDNDGMQHAGILVELDIIPVISPHTRGIRDEPIAQTQKLFSEPNRERRFSARKATRYPDKPIRLCYLHEPGSTDEAHRHLRYQLNESLDKHEAKDEHQRRYKSRMDVNSYSHRALRTRRKSQVIGSSMSLASK